jgi:15-cis-phytoene desaturase
MPDDSLKPRVVIAGGGLAGLTCAKYLVDVGVEVEVLEALPYLGGRASTFLDDDGDWIEQGLHLFLGAYTDFKQLLREIGQPVRDVLFWRDEVFFAEPNGPQAMFGVNPLRAPLRTLGGALGNNKYLSARDKLSLLPLVAPAFQSMKKLRSYDDRTVRDHWKNTSGRDRVFDRILQPFCRAIQFTDAEDFSAYNFLGWLHQTIIKFPNARLGGYKGARDETIFQPLAHYLEQRGATIRTGVKIKEILYSQELGQILGFVRDDGSLVEADAYVAAMPSWIFEPMIPEPLRAMPFFAEISTLPVASAICVQLWLDRRVVDHDGYHLIPRTDVVVFQDQSLRTYPYADGSRLSVDIAPAEQYLAWDPADLVSHTMGVLGAAYPAIAQAKVVKSVVLKHPQHLLRPLPGVMTRRPSQETPVSNLFLAGDWTEQDFFGSQEGAVRSGKACAKALRTHLGI